LSLEDTSPESRPKTVVVFKDNVIETREMNKVFEVGGRDGDDDHQDGDDDHDGHEGG
jgi:hypothetical protein